LTELVTTFFTGYFNLTCYIAALNREDRKDREENIIMGSWLSFMPDHTLDSILDA
jgi:hypothetical protein